MNGHTITKFSCQSKIKDDFHLKKKKKNSYTESCKKNVLKIFFSETNEKEFTSKHSRNYPLQSLWVILLIGNLKELCMYTQHRR